MVRRRSPRRATTGRRSGIFVAALLAAAWAASAWWPEERRLRAGNEARPPHAGVPRPPFTFDVSPPAAAQRGEFGFPMLLVEALADPRSSTAAGAFAGPGLTAEGFRALYEADPGQSARFLFARRTPRPDWKTR